MADETTICSACGNEMLVRTGKRHGGKCIPCANGYRESLEKAKAYYDEQKRQENDPDVLFWRSLCQRVDNPVLGFNSLPVPEKLYFSVCLLDGEIFNGGFEQYFSNSYADYFDYALQGLEKMGDERGLELTLKAKRLLFGERDVPNRDERLEYFESTKILDDSEIIDILDGLDEEFREHSSEELLDTMAAFGLENGFWEQSVDD